MKKIHKLIFCLLVLSLTLWNLGFVDLSEAATSKPLTKIKIGGGRVGDPLYILSEALAYFVNHGSEWLRATVVATPGLTGAIELAMKAPNEYIYVNDVQNFIHMQKDPYGKAYNYYNKSRFISTQSSNSFTWVTLDKNIKTAKDLAGKTVGIKRKAAPYYPEVAILRHWGVLDQVKLVHSGFGEAVKNLKDGLMDVSHLTFDHIYPSGFSKGAFITDLETRGPVYYISTDPAIIKEIYKEGIAGDISIRIPPGALDPKTQPNELWCYSGAIFFSADERMDPDIVYEITRVIWESAGKWGNWHPQGKHMTKDFIPASPIDLQFVHPGAKKFYDERGVKIRKLGDLLR
jgi:TRAP transporter TAXI family solute receptor